MSVFTIQVVTGTSPNWSLKVDTSANILVDDQVLCLVGGSTAGGVYRVAGIPDSTHVAIVDDLGDQLYGRPGAGRASSWTPTPNLGLSQVPDSAYLWGTTSRRDGQLIDQMVAIARGTLELTDPASITPAQVLANAVLLISSTVVPVPGTNGETLSTATMPRDGYDLSAETSWELAYLTDQTLHGALTLYTATFPDPTRISAAVLTTELNNAASPSILNFRVGGSSLDKLYIQRSEAGSTKYIQVDTPRPGPGVYDLNDILQWDTVSKHYGTDPAVLTFALPGPTDPTAHKGLLITVACPQASERTFTYTPMGRSLNTGTPGNAVQWLWDGAAWLVMPGGIP